MGIEHPGRYQKIDEIEVHEAVQLEIAAAEIGEFLFNSMDGHPFKADRFTIEQLKESFFARPKDEITVPLSRSDFLPALKLLCEQGLLGFDKETETYYDKAGA
jgi:hypothetical protein